MQIITGGITTGDDFFEARKQYLSLLDDELKKGDVLIVGPRRTGKTSLIKQYILLHDQHHCLYLNLEDTKSLYQFYVRLIREILVRTDKWGLIREDSSGFIRDCCNKLSETFNGKIKLSPDQLGSEIEATIEISIPTFDKKKLDDLQNQLSVILSKIKIPLLLVLDEFPEVIFRFPEEERQKYTKELMSGLRALRQKMSFDEKKLHKVIIAGSVNLQNTLNSLGLSDTINDLIPIKVNNLTPDESVQLLEILASSAKLKFDNEDNVKEYVKKQFGYCTPFYIQLFADNLRTVQNYKKISGLKNEHLLDAYKALLKGDRGPNYFLKRIENRTLYTDKECEQAISILSLLAKKQALNKGKFTADEDLKNVVKEHLKREKILNKLILDDVLQVGDGGRYGFDCQLIANYWNHTLNGGAFQNE